MYCEEGPNGWRCAEHEDSGTAMLLDGGGTTDGASSGGPAEGGDNHEAGPLPDLGGAADAGVDAPSDLDASAVMDRPADLGSTDTGSGRDLGVLDAVTCSEGTSRSCAMDGFLGNCARGTEMCRGGRWGACSVTAQAADRCDVAADDATCDGKANEGCPCVTGDKQPCGPSMDVGLCKRGIETCANGQWGACVGAVYAEARDCTSSLDNDCDGEQDNMIDSACKCGPVNSSQVCDTHPQDGAGPCHAGMRKCVAGTNNASTNWGPCANSVGPASADTCAPGNDDNCNGLPNENCKALGQGCKSDNECLSSYCVQGTCCGTTCPASNPSTCGNDGTCDASGVCKKHRNGTICAAAFCADVNSSHEASTCQAGICKPGKLCDYHGCDDLKPDHCGSICPSRTIDTGTDCQHCGDESEPCCGNLCEGTNLGCLMSMVDGKYYCSVCGGLNNRCCKDSTPCREGQCLPTLIGGGACQNCGLLGQPCCANMQCSQGACAPKPNGLPYCQ
jgi:hypothetical protein